MVTRNQELLKLAEKIGVPALFLKREDEHPLGSHKGRSIPLMIDAYIKEGFKNFVISSSGNAALAAALHIKSVNSKSSRPIALSVFTGKNIGQIKKEKLFALADKNILVEECERPLQKYTLATKKTDVKGLRQSTDVLALSGYVSLAEELSEIKDLSAVFIATSSGTTAQALGEYFVKHDFKIAIYVVQTQGCHPFASEFDFPAEGLFENIADAIVDKIAYRKDTLLALLEKLGGSGLICSDSEIRNAQQILKDNEVTVSPNGALAFAGLLRSISKDVKFNGAVACIIGGQ